jgi:hypothetical protein
MYLGPGIEVGLDLQKKSLACLICRKFRLLAEIEPRESQLLFFEGKPVGCPFFLGWFGFWWVGGGCAHGEWSDVKLCCAGLGGM